MNPKHLWHPFSFLSKIKPKQPLSLQCSFSETKKGRKKPMKGTLEITVAPPFCGWTETTEPPSITAPFYSSFGPVGNQMCISQPTTSLLTTRGSWFSPSHWLCCFWFFTLRSCRLCSYFFAIWQPLADPTTSHLSLCFLLSAFIHQLLFYLLSFIHISFPWSITKWQWGHINPNPFQLWQNDQ